MNKNTLTALEIPRASTNLLAPKNHFISVHYIIETSMNAFLDAVRTLVRSIIRRLARLINVVTGGRVSPNAVTITSLLAHIPIAWLIATRHNVWAAGLLVIFGLFDVLDGELARLQGTTSTAGMLLDSVTDRMKEVLLYTGAAYAIVFGSRPHMAVWAVAA